MTSFTVRSKGFTPNLLLPWEQPEWKAAITAWINQELSERGYPRAKRIEVVKCWCFACVLRVEVGFYCKASFLQGGSPIFGLETQLLRLLAEKYPTVLPQIVAIESNEGWILMRDAGTLLAQQTEHVRWEQALRQCAALQQATTLDVDELLQCGVPDRRVERLPQHLEWLLQDRKAMACFTRSEVQQLERCVPCLEKLCQRLDAYQIPATLTHGDLHPKNVACTDDRLVFFDWSDAAIAHPFFDAVRFCTSAVLHQQPRLRAALQATYLACWQGFEPRERLEQALALATVLSRMHLAISFQQSCRLCWTPELQESLLFEIRMFLQMFRAQPECFL